MWNISVILEVCVDRKLGCYFSQSSDRWLSCLDRKRLITNRGDLVSACVQFVLSFSSHWFVIISNFEFLWRPWAGRFVLFDKNQASQNFPCVLWLFKSLFRRHPDWTCDFLVPPCRIREGWLRSSCTQFVPMHFSDHFSLPLWLIKPFVKLYASGESVTEVSAFTRRSLFREAIRGVPKSNCWWTQTGRLTDWELG